ncbi:hypothetical protein BX600DRAFT_513893 [Xylariales sp. PMI_506]|nr:hypothetical protein BX600DRAFT_513893 [Xylariales sp. PMI_506]
MVGRRLQCNGAASTGVRAQDVNVAVLGVASRLNAGDESKPRCRRCIDVDAECQYVAHIQFLEKNSWTVPDNTAVGQPTNERPVEQYVVEATARENPSSRLGALGQLSILQPTRNAALLPNWPIETLSATTGAQEEFSFNEPLLHHNEEKDRASSPMVQSATAHSIHGIRTKGVATGSGKVPDAPSNAPEDFQGRKWDDDWPMVGRCSLTSDEVELLKHYTTVVAPWLDVFDLERTFGLLVPRLAVDSPCIMDGVLHLAAASSRSEVKTTERRAIGPLLFLALAQPPDKDSGLSALRIVASVLLLKARVFIQEEPDDWEPCLQGGGAPFGFDKYSFTDPVPRRVWNSFVALISRTEIAYCLIKETGPAMDTDFLRDTIMSRSATQVTPAAQSSLDASICCLALLADVMKLVLPPSEREETSNKPDNSTTPVAPLSEKWKALLAELLRWYTSRPPELQTLVELEGWEAAFPSVIFTNSAGIWANVIYHTVMLLLLNHRPRSVSMAEWQKSAAVDKGHFSPLWHARRVCGIALGTDPELTRCWDPCMIAAFSIAARRMTHPAQQRDLVACLNRVKAAGWRVDSVIQGLHEEWGTADL